MIDKLIDHWHIKKEEIRKEISQTKVNDYMTLCLHMIQKMKIISDDN